MKSGEAGGGYCFFSPPLSGFPDGELGERTRARAPALMLVLALAALINI